MKKKTKKQNSTSVVPSKKVVIKSFEHTPNRYLGKGDPLNLEEQKHKFLYQGVVPEFKFKVSEKKLESISGAKRAEIRHELLPQATKILEKVREKYGSGDGFVQHTYGHKITSQEGSELLKGYMVENAVDGMMSITWSKDLSCSGRMSWVGPSLKANKPDARKYRLMLQDSAENAFLRERGILCIADHEIGTHFIRSYNDGLQPWFSNRQQFGLHKLSSLNLLQTEEGLATLNTLLKAKSKYLYYPALLYYTASKGEEMTFHELFDHLKRYIIDSEMRWKYVMRVKRYLPDPNMKGGSGKDQCYFKGAVDILQNLDEIDFDVLFSGKIALDDLPRVKHSARLSLIKLPGFMKDKEAYISSLRKIALLNEIHKKPSKRGKHKSGKGIRGKKQPVRSGSLSRSQKRHVKKCYTSEDKKSCPEVAGDKTAE